MRFEIEARDGRARRGRLNLARGSVETPVFMPVKDDYISLLFFAIDTCIVTELSKYKVYFEMLQ